MLTTSFDLSTLGLDLSYLGVLNSSSKGHTEHLGESAMEIVVKTIPKADPRIGEMLNDPLYAEHARQRHQAAAAEWVRQEVQRRIDLGDPSRRSIVRRILGILHGTSQD